MENSEQTSKNATETNKTDGRFANVSLTPGSETHRRFVRLMTEAGINSPKGMVDILMDAYENPPQDADSAATIIAMEQNIADLKAECTAHCTTEKNLEQEIADLKLQLATARNEANDNAAKAMQIQTATEGCIIVRLDPVSAYFMAELVKESGKKPETILAKLFFEDIQNPNANHLPGDYTVSSSRVRRVMKELETKPKP